MKQKDECEVQIIPFLEASQEKLRFKIERKVNSSYMLEGVKDEMGTVIWIC
jgi:hypothetical protein